MTEETITQQLMTQAYAMWRAQQDWDMKKFHNMLEGDQQLAVPFGQFNYQTENGGLSQWHGNGYITEFGMNRLRHLLEQVDSHASKKALSILDEFFALMDRMEIDPMNRDSFCDEWDQDEYEEVESRLSSAYYKINAQLLKDVDEFLEQRRLSSAALPA